MLSLLAHCCQLPLLMPLLLLAVKHQRSANLPLLPQPPKTYSFC
jgi:hypothetical protein